VRDSVDDSLIATAAVAEATSNTTDGGDANACQIVDFAIRQVFLQVFNDLPTINQSLKLSWCTQILEKTTHFRGVFQFDEGREKVVLSLSSLPL
jgi:hypothetical protein